MPPRKMRSSTGAGITCTISCRATIGIQANSKYALTDTFQKRRRLKKMPRHVRPHITSVSPHSQPFRKYERANAVKVPVINRKMHTWSSMRKKVRMGGVRNVCERVEAA